MTEEWFFERARGVFGAARVRKATGVTAAFGPR
jgi:hypothetical protein